jgi:hypothetical protein
VKSLACFSFSVAIELASSSHIVVARKLSVRVALFDLTLTQFVAQSDHDPLGPGSNLGGTQLDAVRSAR